MISSITRFDIENFDRNGVEKHGGFEQIGLVLVLEHESMKYMIENVFSLRWNYKELKEIVKLRLFTLAVMIL